MNSYMYDDWSERDNFTNAEKASPAAYWEEMFDISRALETLGLHK